MSHSFSQNNIHLIFSTKERGKTIPKVLQTELWAYLAGVCKNNEMEPRAVGGTGNHVHVLFYLPPKLALAKAVLLMKSNSSRWMSEQGYDFWWQEGYAAFSVSSSNVDAVIRYIRNQEAHHRKISFEDEFCMILKKHGIEYDTRYVFG